VQERQASDLGAKVFRISGNRQQCLGSGTEQHPIDGAAILKRYWSHLVSNGEHDMKVLRVKELPLTSV
jgi:hypothetical protein